MFKLLGAIGRSAGLLVTGAGVGVGVTQSDEIIGAAKSTSKGLKLAAVGVGVYLLVKALK